MYRRTQTLKEKNIRKQKLEEKYEIKKQKLDIRIDLINQITLLDNKKVKKEEEIHKINKKSKYKEFNILKENRIQSKEPIEIPNEINMKKDIIELNNNSSSSAVEVFKYKPINILEYESNTSESSESKEITPFIKSVKIFNRKKEIIEFRKNLPIFYEEEQIISSVRENSITVISGGTGCGKSTQIPQFLLENGFENIIITQPRRIATVSLCSRINYELNEDLCGFKIMYESTIKKHHKIHILTDGTLLNKIREDKLLSKVDLVILDEFHERNINLDLLVPLLIKITEERNLKIILMSATMDFILPFKYELINIESNNYRVFLNWGDKNNYLIQIETIIEKILKSEQTGNYLNINNEKSHILIFLPSKKDIYSLKKTLLKYNNRCIILPLHSQLIKEEQENIFKDTNKRKIILSTNIAETSLTIPGIVYVIDTGLEKCKLYLNDIIEYKTQLISKSSAIQRMGRAGRERTGICYRTFPYEIYEKMKDSKPSAILKECFDDGLLFLKALGFNKINEFKFLIPPINIKVSEKRLENLGAINKNGEITQVGIQMSRIPIPCRLSRILCSSDVTSELLLVIGVMALNINIEINSKYIYEKSDFIAKTLTVLDIIKNNNKEYLSIIKFMQHYKLNINELNFNNQTKTHILKIIYKGFCDKLCLKHDSGYIYNGDILYLDNKSVKIDSEYIVFDYLVQGKTKKYLKGISLVDSNWF